MSILIVEDDLEIANSIQVGLQQNNLDCRHVNTAKECLSLLDQQSFQLIIADLMLPDQDGLEMISQIRKKGIQVPVLILSAKRSLDDRVLGLQNGGDDYMVKPYAFVELLARIKNLLKRSTPDAQVSSLSFQDIKLNLITREVTRGTTKIELQTKEFQLLELFIRHPNQPLSKIQILEKIWGYNFDPQTNVVDVLVYRLRNKIDKDFEKSYLHTIRGIGYVLKAE
jgi:DNA-binding response OmpR family regulator